MYAKNNPSAITTRTTWHANFIGSVLKVVGGGWVAQFVFRSIIGVDPSVILSIKTKGIPARITLIAVNLVGVRYSMTILLTSRSICKLSYMLWVLKATIAVMKIGIKLIVQVCVIPLSNELPNTTIKQISNKAWKFSRKLPNSSVRVQPEYDIQSVRYILDNHEPA